MNEELTGMNKDSQKVGLSPVFNYIVHDTVLALANKIEHLAFENGVLENRLLAETEKVKELEKDNKDIKAGAAASGILNRILKTTTKDISKDLDFFECAQCDAVHARDGEWLVKFCPTCGAEITGLDDNDEEDDEDDCE